MTPDDGPPPSTELLREELHRLRPDADEQRARVRAFDAEHARIARDRAALEATAAREAAMQEPMYRLLERIYALLETRLPAPPE